MPSAPGAAPTVAEASQWGNEQLLSIDAINAPASLGGMTTVLVSISRLNRSSLMIKSHPLSFVEDWCNNHFCILLTGTACDNLTFLLPEIAGAPALTVPIALMSAEGLPLGLQVLAGPSQEALMLAVGHVLEMGAQSGFRGSLLAPLHAPDEGKAPISTV